MAPGNATTEQGQNKAAGSKGLAVGAGLGGCGGKPIPGRRQLWPRSRGMQPKAGLLVQQ